MATHRRTHRTKAQEEVKQWRQTEVGRREAGKSGRGEAAPDSDGGHATECSGGCTRHVPAEALPYPKSLVTVRTNPGPPHQRGRAIRAVITPAGVAQDEFGDHAHDGEQDQAADNDRGQSY